MLRLLKAIRVAGQQRTPAYAGRMKVIQKTETLGPALAFDNYLRVTFEAAVRFETTGPEEALSEMKRKAELALAREVFGEIEDDLKSLQILLWEEDIYRGPQDPVMTKLNDMLKTLKGETND